MSGTDRNGCPDSPECARDPLGEHLTPHVVRASSLPRSMAGSRVFRRYKLLLTEDLGGKVAQGPPCGPHFGAEVAGSGPDHPAGRLVFVTPKN